MAPRLPRPSRPVRLLGWVLFFALLTLMGLDRAGAWWSSQRAADELKVALQTERAPHVSIHDMPWLTQAIDHRFSHISVDADHARLGGFPVDRIEGELFDVAVNAQGRPTTIGRMTASGRASWADMSEATGVKLESASGGRVRAEYTATVFDEQMTAHVIALPIFDVSTQTFQLRAPELTIDGVEIPDDLTQQLLDDLVEPLSLKIPKEIRVTGLTAAPEGVTVSIEGHNLDATSLR